MNRRQLSERDREERLRYAKLAYPRMLIRKYKGRWHVRTVSCWQEAMWVRRLRPTGPGWATREIATRLAVIEISLRRLRSYEARTR